MNIWKFAAVSAALLSSTGLGSTASAGTFHVTSVGLSPYDSLTVNGKSEIATAIKLTVTELPKPLYVFCVDLIHTIGVGGYSPPLVYTSAPVTTDSTGAASGTGNPLSNLQSEEIHTLTNIGGGLAGAASPDVEKLTAIQGAIWEIEYGFTPAQVVGTASENLLIADDIAYAAAHPSGSDANGIYPVGPYGQGFGYSQGFSAAVPEPAAWSMMIVGVGFIGAALRRRRAAGGVAGAV